MPFPVEVFEKGKVVEKMADVVVTQAGGRPDQYVKIDGALYERYAENPMQWVKSEAKPNVLDPADPVTSSSEPQGTALNGDQMRPGEGVAPSEAKDVADEVARGEHAGHGDKYDPEEGANAHDQAVADAEKEAAEASDKEHEKAQADALKAEKAAAKKPAAKKAE